MGSPYRCVHPPRDDLLFTAVPAGCLRVISAPIASRPLKWRSIGRLPIVQPQAWKLAWPLRAKTGPKTTIEAASAHIFIRHFFELKFLSRASTTTILSSSLKVTCAFNPREQHLFDIVVSKKTSDKTGTFSGCHASALLSIAARRGRTAFLSPFDFNSSNQSTMTTITDYFSTSRDCSQFLKSHAFYHTIFFIKCG